MLSWSSRSPHICGESIGFATNIRIRPEVVGLKVGRDDVLVCGCNIVVSVECFANGCHWVKCAPYPGGFVCVFKRGECVRVISKYTKSVSKRLRGQAQPANCSFAGI